MDLILRFATKNRISVLAIQEQHINTTHKLDYVTKRFEKKGVSLICPVTMEGRRGAALAFSANLSLISFKLLFDRLCFPSLKSDNAKASIFSPSTCTTAGPQDPLNGALSSLTPNSSFPTKRLSWGTLTLRLSLHGTQRRLCRSPRTRRVLLRPKGPEIWRSSLFVN